MTLNFKGLVDQEEQPGPILSLLTTRSFDHVFLFDTPSTQRVTGETKDAIVKLHRGSEVHVLEVNLADPTNYQKFSGDSEITFIASLRISLQRTSSSPSRREHLICMLVGFSEYYDRDRSAFYRAIQSVRERGMDMTGWLEYFVEGLTTQLVEVRERGEQAIRRDVLIKEHRLSDRQAKALGHILEHGSLTIQDLEHLFHEVNRRSLQRDLKTMVDMGLLVSEGATNKLVYRMKEAG